MPAIERTPAADLEALVLQHREPRPAGEPHDASRVVEMVVVAEHEVMAKRRRHRTHRLDERFDAVDVEIDEVSGERDEIRRLRSHQFDRAERPLHRQQAAEMQIAVVGDADPVEGQRPVRERAVETPYHDRLVHVPPRELASSDRLRRDRDDAMADPRAAVLAVLPSDRRILRRLAGAVPITLAFVVLRRRHGNHSSGRVGPAFAGVQKVRRPPTKRPCSPAAERSPFSSSVQSRRR